MSDPFNEAVSVAATNATINPDGSVSVTYSDETIETYASVGAMRQQIVDQLSSAALKTLIIADYLRAFGGNYTPGRALSVRKRCNFDLRTRTFSVSDEVQ